MAFAEALSHGLPVVAARAGAVPRTVPESAGLLVPPGDAAALAAALQRVIAAPDLRRRLAAGALAAGALLPDWDQSVRCWAAAFDRLGAGPPSIAASTRRRSPRITTSAKPSPSNRPISCAGPRQTVQGA